MCTGRWVGNGYSQEVLERLAKYQQEESAKLRQQWKRDGERYYRDWANLVSPQV